MKFKEKTFGNKEFSVDLHAQKTTLAILKRYLNYHGNEEFSVKPFINFARIYFGDFYPDSLTESGFYRRFYRLRNNHILNSKKECNGKVIYHLTKLGEEKMENIQELKGGI